MINVLHFTTSLNTERNDYFISLAESYSRDRYCFMFCSLYSGGPISVELTRRGHKCFSLSNKSYFTFPITILKLVGLLRKEKIDVLHTHLFDASFVGTIAAKLARTKLCVMGRHYTDIVRLSGKKLLILMDNITGKLADRIIVSAPAVKKYLIEVEKINPKKISTVWFGFDCSKMRISSIESVEHLKQSFGLGKDIRVITTIARLDKYKGHVYLIKASQDSIKSHPQVKFLIVGDGVMRHELQTLVANLGLEDYIIFTGYRKDIPDILALTDILVHPSLTEVFGIVILEAMTMGKPVIATNVGATHEVIQNGVNGILIPPHDSIAIAMAINKLLNAYTDALNMGQAGKKYVEKNFSFYQMVKSYEQLYDTHLKSK